MGQLWAGKETFMISEVDCNHSTIFFFVCFLEAGISMIFSKQIKQSNPNLHIIITCVLQGKEKDSCLADMQDDEIINITAVWFKKSTKNIALN